MEKITIGINSISKEEKKKVIEKLELMKLWVPENTYFGIKNVRKFRFDVNGDGEFEVPILFEFLNIAIEVNRHDLHEYVKSLENTLRPFLKNTYANVYIKYSTLVEYELFMCDNTVADIIPFIVIDKDIPMVEMDKEDRFFYLHRRYSDKKEPEASKYKFAAEMHPDVFMEEQEKLEK